MICSTVDTRVEGPHDIVTVSGELDLATAPQLSEAIRSVLVPGRSHLVLDLDQVSFIDSTGLSVLVAAHRRAIREGGSFGLVCNSDRCMRVMHMTGLARLFSFHASVAAATAASAAGSDVPRAAN